MYCKIFFDPTSNPKVTLSNEGFFQTLCDYDLRQVTPFEFVAVGLEPRDWNGGKQTREGKKLVLEAFAYEWQSMFDSMSYSYSELVDWQDFFTEYGRKYGLLRQFHENAIC